MKNLHSYFLVLVLFITSSFITVDAQNGLTLKAYHWVPTAYPTFPDETLFHEQDVTSTLTQDFIAGTNPSNILENSLDSFPNGLTGRPLMDYNIGGGGHNRLLLIFEGFIAAEATGDYEFRIASKHGSRFSISTDDNAANLTPLVGVYGDLASWKDGDPSSSEPNHYNKYAPLTNSEEFGKYPSQQQDTVSLVVGEFHAIKLEFKVLFGNNSHFTVQWKAPGTATFENIPVENLFVTPGDFKPKLFTPNVTVSTSGNSATIQWDTVTNATEYKVLQNGSEIGTTTDTSMTVNDLAQGTYGFVVIATNPGNYRESNQSTPKYAEIGDTGTNINNSLNMNIKVYPNPASQSLHISGVEQVNAISVYSLDGKAMDVSNNLNSMDVNISNLERGVYILSVTTNKGTAIEKFIKE